MLSTPLQLTPLLAQITWSIRLMAIAFVVISVFMMLVILIQKPKGGGLSGAFGGAGGSDTSFVGAKVGDFLTILTVCCFLAFLLLGMGLTWAINPTENSAAAEEQTTSTGAGMGAPPASETETPLADLEAQLDADADATTTPTDAPALDATDATDATDAAPATDAPAE